MTVTYAEALEVALCYGWIDGQKRPESEQAWLQRFLPRGVAEYLVEDQPGEGAGAHRKRRDAGGGLSSN